MASNEGGKRARRGVRKQDDQDPVGMDGQGPIPSMDAHQPTVSLVVGNDSPGISLAPSASSWPNAMAMPTTTILSMEPLPPSSRPPPSKRPKAQWIRPEDVGPELHDALLKRFGPGFDMSKAAYFAIDRTGRTVTKGNLRLKLVCPCVYDKPCETGPIRSLIQDWFVGKCPGGTPGAGLHMAALCHPLIAGPGTCSGLQGLQEDRHRSHEPGDHALRHRRLHSMHVRVT
jgi:hypothetical protein